MAPLLPRWFFVCAIPPLAVVCASAVLMVLGAFERNPFWPRQDITMAEAAALRDPGTVAFMVQTGVDPNAVMTVRTGVLDDRPHRMTPAEAAIRADRTEVLATLFARGVRVDQQSVQQWFCLASQTSADESQAFLRERYAEWTAIDCARIAVP